MAATNDRGNSYHTLGTNSSPDYFLEPWLESHWTSAHFTTLSSGDPNGDAPIYRHAAAEGRGFGTFKGVVDTELYAYGIPGRVRRQNNPAVQLESYFNVTRHTVKQALLLRPEEQVLTPQKLGASYARKLARWWTPYEERWAFRTMSAGGFTFPPLTTDVPFNSYTDAQLIATMEEAFTSTTTFESSSGVAKDGYGEGSTGACAVFCSDADPGYIVGVTSNTYATMNETNGINPKAVSACAARLRNRGVAPPALNPQAGMPSAGRGYILFVEATAVRGKGGLILTGQLGDVMKESAQAALSLLKARAARLGIAPESFEKSDIHVHVPAGATPKDGPSAGVAIFVALTSLLSGRPVHSDVAMTGEISLRGLVLPIGGVKEKVLAAQRAGIKRVLLPARNQRDLEDIPAEVRAQLEFVWLEQVDDAIANALAPAAGPAV